MRKVMVWGAALVLAGCASSGPVPMGQDTWYITKQSSTGFNSAASVKADLYREANDYCVSQGRQLQPISDSGVDGQPGRALANAQVTFRCLLAGDPELSRPVLKPRPDIVIENH